MAADPYEVATPSETVYMRLRVRDATRMLDSSEIAAINLGQEGATFLNGASSAIGTYRSIFHIANTTYTSNHMVNWDGTWNVAAYTFPAGSWIYGEFVNPAISSGTCICYKGVV